MILTGPARLGRDVILREAGNGQVANLALAYNWGRAKEGQDRPTQWVDASLWGKRAEALAPYLKKGQQVDVVIKDVHIETYDTQNGKGYKIVGEILEIELIGGRPGGDDRAPAPPPARAPAPPPAAPAPAKTGGGAPF